MADASSSHVMLPLDTFNERLLANVHPRDWQNPVPAPKYNMVVIGGGTAGLVTAVGAAQLGGKVAIVEKRLFGGDCLITGCVPSKAVLKSARVAATVREAGEFGVKVPDGSTVDFATVMERMRRLRSEISPSDSAQRLQTLGIDVFIGAAHFTGPQTVEVEGQTLKFARACIATGSRPATPPITGLDAVDFLTSETIFDLTERPNRFAIIGGGPIGCEMAQAFSRLGSQVTLLEIADHLLPHDDADAGKSIAEQLRRDGVAVHTGMKISKVEAREAGGAVLHLHDRGSITVDKLLVATGRVPNVRNMNLEAAGVAFDVRAGIEVNEKLRTKNKRIFAAGDVCSQFKFTHAADALARIVLKNALFSPASGNSTALTIPRCTFTDPEVAQVGLTPAEAGTKGVKLDTLTVELADNDRAVVDGETHGFVRVHLKPGSDKILGATIVAAHAGDLIGYFGLAMDAGIGLKSLAETIFPYPTQAGAIRRLGDQFNLRRVHGLTKKMLHLWLGARRRM